MMGFTFVVRDVVEDITSALTELVTSAATSSVSFVIDVVHIGLLAVVTLVIGFYMTRDAEKVIDSLIGTVPPGYRLGLRAMLAQVYEIWCCFFRGQLILCLTAGVILGTASALLGLPQPVLLGIWGGLLEFLPTVGHMIWGLTALLLAILSGSTYLPLPPVAFVLLVLGVYVVFTQIDLNVLIPHIIGSSVRLHPLVVLLGVVAGIEIGGVLGVALAAPTIASIRVDGQYVLAWLFGLQYAPAADTRSPDESFC